MERKKYKTTCRKNKIKETVEPKEKKEHMFDHPTKKKKDKNRRAE